MVLTRCILFVDWLEAAGARMMLVVRVQTTNSIFFLLKKLKL